MDSIILKWNLDSVKVLLSILSTFLLTCIAWVFFRARTITDAVLYLKRIFTNKIFKYEYLEPDRYNFELLIMVLVFVLIEWWNRNNVEPISGKRSMLKIALAILAIIAFGTYSDYKEFIYFQF